MQEFCYINSKKSHREVLPDCFCLEERYILKYMKSGGYSNIYFAFDLKRKKQVLVKELYVEALYMGRDNQGFLLPNEAEKGKTDNKLALFIKEAQKMNQLNGIKSIPKMYDFIIKSGNAFIVMEYINGTNIYNMKATTSQMILKCFKPLVNDLVIMHNNNIIHRDISTRNIILVDGKIKLVDLGIARKIYHDGLKANDSDLIFTEQIETKTVSSSKPIEQRTHSYQDSRTDIYSLAKIMLNIYDYKGIIVPKKIRKVLEKSKSYNIEERYDSKKFYELLYGKRERIRKRSFVLFSILIFIVIVFMLNPIENEPIQDKDISEDMMKKRIEAKSGYFLKEDYTKYADFDGDGVNEIFAFLPIEIDTMDRGAEWIKYGEIWFCDEEKVTKVDELGADDIAEGGIYTIELIQLGKEYHFEVNKYYGLVASAKGPSYIYTYRDGQPQKIHVGDSAALTVVNGGNEEETFLTDSKYKFTTDGTGRTFDKIYTYYKDNEYVIYKTEPMEMSDLYKYDNYKELVLKCVEDIYIKRSLNSVEKAEKITEYTEDISGKHVNIFECTNNGTKKYISLVNCYLNESGRIYLNMTCWDQKEMLLASHIWDETNPYYPDPVDYEAHVGVGFNYYITFKIRKNHLEMEWINEGYWEKHFTDKDFSGKELFD